MIGTLIIGFGYSAQTFHLPFIAALTEFKLLGFVERSPKSTGLYPQTKSFTDIHEAIDALKPDLVIITTPNETHFEFAKIALEKNCHVLIEKPATVSVKEAETLFEISKKKKLVCSVFHNRRFDGDYLTLKKVIKSGQIGNLVQLEMRFDRFAPQIRTKAWKEAGAMGSELVDDLGSHLVDQAFDLFGKIECVYAWSAIQRQNSKIRDSFIIHLKSDQTLIELRANMLSAIQPIKFLANGTQGSLLITGTDDQENQLKAKVSPLAFEYGSRGITQTALLTNKNGNIEIPFEKGSYIHFYQKLSSAILNNTEVPVPISDAIEIMKILEVARCEDS